MGVVSAGAAEAELGSATVGFMVDLLFRSSEPTPTQ